MTDDHTECMEHNTVAAQAIGTAIKAVTSSPCALEYYGGPVTMTRFVLVAEVWADDGERYLLPVCSAGTEPWEVDGILNWARRMVPAQLPPA